MLWALRWLVFRLMFSSGCVKLLSGDPTWHSLTALEYHYQTQPLPTWLGWHAHQLPGWFQSASTVAMFAIELILPWFIFLPRRLRQFACWSFVLFQAVIALTGNYGFFNLLTVALCVTLLDDQAFLKLAPKGWRESLARGLVPPAQGPRPRGWKPRRWAVGLVAMVVLSLTLVPLSATCRLADALPRWLIALYGWTQPFRSVNGYGLFAVMTTSRPELILEGSRNGKNWLAYEFKHKPGDLQRPPGCMAPHLPRLDWQMWFAALGELRQNPWLVNLCLRLLDGSPEVLALLRTNPFPDRPPKYIRILKYDYQFTDPTSRRATGRWWKRELIGEYMAPLALPSAPREHLFEL